MCKRNWCYWCRRKYYSLLDTVCGKGSIVKDILEEKDEIDLDIDITDDFFDIDK